jgi:hypothetical protein
MLPPSADRKETHRNDFLNRSGHAEVLGPDPSASRFPTHDLDGDGDGAESMINIAAYTLRHPHPPIAERDAANSCVSHKLVVFTFELPSSCT